EVRRGSVPHVAIHSTRSTAPLRPAPSGGGPRRGAPRLRSACRYSFHSFDRASAPGAIGGWPDTRCAAAPFRMSLFIPLVRPRLCARRHRGVARDEVRRGSVPHVAIHSTRSTAPLRPARSGGGPTRGAPRLRSACRYSFHSFDRAAAPGAIGRWPETRCNAAPCPMALFLPPVRPHLRARRDRPL